MADNKIRIKQGAKATWVVYMSAERFPTIIENDDGTTENSFVETGRRFPNWHAVFNLDQLELGEFKLPEREPSQIGALAQELKIPVANVIIEEYLKNSGILVFTKPMRKTEFPHFNPLSDQITMPRLSDYDDQDAFTSTMYHEMGHSTGVSKRLNRTSLVEYSIKQERAKEELTAEFVSIFLCALTGVIPMDNSRLGHMAGIAKNKVAYLESWLKHLGNDPKYLMEAVTQAGRAFDYILKVVTDGISPEPKAQVKTRSAVKSSMSLARKAKALKAKEVKQQAKLEKQPQVKPARTQRLQHLIDQKNKKRMESGQIRMV